MEFSTRSKPWRLLRAGIPAVARLFRGGGRLCPLGDEPATKPGSKDPGYNDSDRYSEAVSTATASGKLPQKPHVILEIELQIVDVVFQLRQPLDTQSERETRILLGVVIHETVDGGIDHARAE